MDTYFLKKASYTARRSHALIIRIHGQVESLGRKYGHDAMGYIYVCITEYQIRRRLISRVTPTTAMLNSGKPSKIWVDFENERTEINKTSDTHTPTRRCLTRTNQARVCWD